MSDYEKLATEQEERRLFDVPVRSTTVCCHPSKMTYQEFVDFLQTMGLQENLQGGKRFVEDWFEFFLCYHEIERLPANSPDEAKERIRTVDYVVENQIKIRDLGLEI